MQKLLKQIGLCLFLIFQFTNAFTQAKKPTIMVVPSDGWCMQNGYSTNFNGVDGVEKIPNYQAAFNENTDIEMVIGKINELMIDRGFPLTSLQDALKKVKTNMAQNAVITFKSGGEVAESPYDRLMNTAKADIVLKIFWKINKVGPKQSISFLLEGIDAYSNKSIATASGVGQQSFSTELDILLQEAVITYIDKFNSQLQAHFADLLENGREITVDVIKDTNWGSDLESEYNGEELSSIIEDWFAKNTVKGRFSTTDATENMMSFKQVRIPLYDAKNVALDARGFCKGLQKFLNSPPYSIPVKLMTKGTGGATIGLGSK